MHKDVKDLVSVIMIMGKDIIGGDTVFYFGVKSCDFGNRAHILKHSHGKMVFGTFEKVFYEGTLWNGYRSVISFILTKQRFLHFYRHANQFYDQYLNSVNRKKYIDDDGSSEKPKLEIQRRFMKYSCYAPLQEMLDRYKKLARHNFGRKRKPTGCIFLPGSLPDST